MTIKNLKLSILNSGLFLFLSLLSQLSYAGWFSTEKNPLDKYICFEGQFYNTQYKNGYMVPIKNPIDDDAFFMKGSTNILLGEVISKDGSDSCYDYLTVKRGPRTWHVAKMISSCRYIDKTASIAGSDRVYYLSAKWQGDDIAMFIRSYELNSEKRNFIAATLENVELGRVKFTCGPYVFVNGIFYHEKSIQTHP